MRTVTAKTVTTNPVRPTKLGVKMKAQRQCKNQDILSSTCPKSFLIAPKAPKVKEKVRRVESKAVNKTLPPRWNSSCAPRDLFTNDIKFSTSFSELNPKTSPYVTKQKPIRDKIIFGKTKQNPIPPKEKCHNSRSSKHTGKPKLHTNSQKLKQKESEINCLKQKLWLEESHHLDRTRPKVNVLEVLETFKFKEKKPTTSVSNQGDNFLIQKESKKLHNDIAQRDMEILMLKQENWKMQEKLDNQILEFSISQDKLQSKDFEMLDALNDKNHEIVLLKQEKFMLEENVRNQKTDIGILNAEVKKLLEDVCAKDESEYDTGDLEKETADFLDKVSAACKDKSLKVKALSKDINVKIQIKVTVRKEKMDKVSHQLSFSDTFDSPYVFANTPCQDFCVKEEYEDEEVHDNPEPNNSSYNEPVCEVLERRKASKDVTDLLKNFYKTDDDNLSSNDLNVTIPIRTRSRTRKFDLEMQ